MIHEKLTILLTSDIIDQETHDYVLSVLNYLLQNDIIEEEKKADVFLTHLAMADMRRKKSESINDLDYFYLHIINMLREE
jgi:hypothetical protein